MEFNRKRRIRWGNAIEYADNWGNQRGRRRLGIRTIDWYWKGVGWWRGEKQLDCAGRNRFNSSRKQNNPISWRSKCGWHSNRFGQKFLKSGRSRWIFPIVAGLWNQQWIFYDGQQFDRSDKSLEPT